MKFTSFVGSSIAMGLTLLMTGEPGMARTEAGEWQLKPGTQFGKMQWLTWRCAGVSAAEALVWSRDGRRLAFNRRVPTFDSEGKLVKDAGGIDFRQIFLLDFPDADGDAIAEGLQ
jgi:hypothetical protein